MKKSNYDLLQDYYNAVKALANNAYIAIKEYGKELNVVDELKKLIMKENDYENEDEIMEDELEDSIFNNSYFTNFTDKHGFIYNCRIEKVRYNDTKNEIEVYLLSDDGEINDWFPIYYADDAISVYSTILEYIK